MGGDGFDDNVWEGPDQIDIGSRIEARVSRYWLLLGVDSAADRYFSAVYDAFQEGSEVKWIAQGVEIDWDVSQWKRVVRVLSGSGTVGFERYYLVVPAF